MRAYPEYKDSGVEWLGEIPSHWSKTKLKRVLKIRNGQDFKLVETSDEFDSYPVIGSGGEFARATKYLHDGESILLGRKGTINKPIYINEKFWTVDTMFYSHINDDADGKYLFYSTLMIPFGYYQTNTAIPSMTQDDLGNHFVSLPKKSEQIKIRRFLDHETARIDKLISEKQNFIKLLKEKRQALISHVVTKGLDPHVKMKESGIEWIGEVPEHWVSTRLKFLVPKIIDTEHKTIPFVDESDYLVVRTSDIREGELLSNKCRRTNKNNFLEWTRRGTPSSGDIIFTREAPAGEACIVPDNLKVCLGQRTVLIKPSKSLLAEYLLLVIYSDLTKEFIENSSMGSTVKHLNMSDIPNIPIFCPDLHGQKVIVDFVSKEISKIKQLTDLTFESINLLKEHRTALISAAVTGKIDVRDHAK